MKISAVLVVVFAVLACTLLVVTPLTAIQTVIVDSYVNQTENVTVTETIPNRDLEDVAVVMTNTTVATEQGSVPGAFNSAYST